MNLMCDWNSLNDRIHVRPKLGKIYEYSVLIKKNKCKFLCVCNVMKYVIYLSLKYDKFKFKTCI